MFCLEALPLKLATFAFAVALNSIPHSFHPNSSSPSHNPKFLLTPCFELLSAILQTIILVSLRFRNNSLHDLLLPLSTCLEEDLVAAFEPPVE